VNLDAQHAKEHSKAFAVDKERITSLGKRKIQEKEEIEMKLILAQMMWHWTFIGEQGTDQFTKRVEFCCVENRQAVWFAGVASVMKDLLSRRSTSSIPAQWFC
jgi:hypothetical protein